MRTSILFATLWLLGGHAVAAEPAPVLVELFTSQGCSSCPPADELLGELAQRSDVVALAFHVTYWDRLGWPDTFGVGLDRPPARLWPLGAGGLYTRRWSSPVSSMSSVRTGHGCWPPRSRAQARARGPITLRRRRGPPAALSLGAPARLLLAAVHGEVDVAIGRGENAGRTVAYRRIVRSLADLGPWDGAHALCRYRVAGRRRRLRPHRPASRARRGCGARPATAVRPPNSSAPHRAGIR